MDKHAPRFQICSATLTGFEALVEKHFSESRAAVEEAMVQHWYQKCYQLCVLNHLLYHDALSLLPSSPILSFPKPALSMVNLAAPTVWISC